MPAFFPRKPDHDILAGLWEPLRHRIVHAGWSQLRSISNLPITRATILIPVIGYFLIFNAHVVEYLHLTPALTDNTIAQGREVSWRLLLIYFGLCSIGGASAVYQVCCPAEIKRYSSAVEDRKSTRLNSSH